MFWKKLSKKGPIIALAPMDGYTDSAYRQIVKSINQNVICFTEFYSADGIINSKFLAKSVLPHSKIEKPLIVQLFGKNPESFKKAAGIVENFGIAGIDINMGCPAKKVVSSGHGVSLVKDEKTAFKIVEEMVKSVKIPISVKTRLGFLDEKNLINFCKGLENAGASLITIHGRTYKQGFSGEANFAPIYELKKHIKIPIICNGDIKNIDDGIKKMGNLNGFMIGRASFGNPWCFLNGNYKPNLDEILKIMKNHAKLLIKIKGEKKGSLEIRKHLVQYLHDFAGVKNFRKELVTVKNLYDVDKILNKIKIAF